MTPPAVAIISNSGVFQRASLLQFRAMNVRTRVMTRSEVSAERLSSLGADEVICGSVRSQSHMSELLRDMKTLVYDPGTFDNSWEEDQKAVIAAANIENVEHLVFLSCFHPYIQGLPGFHVRSNFEQALTASALTYSVLQPVMFMQNIGYLLPKLAQTGILEWPWNPTKAFSFIDAMDVAEVAVRVATDPALAGGSYELCSEAATGNEIARRLTRMMGRDVSARREPHLRESSQPRVDASPCWSPDTFIGVIDVLDRLGYPGGSDFVAKAILKRAPISIDNFLSRAVAAYPTSSSKEALASDALVDAMFSSWASSEL